MVCAARAWRKHGLCDMRLAEAWFVRDAPGGSICLPKLCDTAKLETEQEECAQFGSTEHPTEAW